ncbi:chalcone isomerase family protein [Tundrisphaera sp. TA3]|uniref:chalcone isomerase family protein n=1 Tax=Tundrisphaera sp. TA3 TaxID=3435775 RepID=UPI003EB7A827
MIRRQFLTAGAFGLVGGTFGGRQAFAAGSGAAGYPATVFADIGGKSVRLSLTGSALRTKYLLRVYSVASYVQEGVSVRSADSLAKIDAAKLLHLIFERDVDGATMAAAFRDSIGMSFPAPAFASELSQLERHFLANPVKQGDHIRLTHVPGTGLGVQVNQKPTMLIRGVGFAQAAWGTYLGPNNLGVALKEGLSSRLR